MYNIRPKVKGSNKHPVYGDAQQIVEELQGLDFQVLAFECYPGVDYEFLRNEIIGRIGGVESIVDTSDFFLKRNELDEVLYEDLTDDELFGRFVRKPIVRFVKSEKEDELAAIPFTGKTIVFGVGASKLVESDLVVYVNITRWQVQLRYKEGLQNWQCDNESDSWNKKIKRGYYFEWPLGDSVKEEVLPYSDYVLDLNDNRCPSMIHTTDYFESLGKFIDKPFRLVPYFAPGVWGGNWMQEKFDVGKDEVNLAWAFDGVPEENSIIFETSDVEFEVPANDLVMFFPKKLMGERVYGRYGKNFPIRFDYLDTMNGQNLSLQVHPTTEYAYKQFGALYTQDESYYIMDHGEAAKVFLGVQQQVNEKMLIPALKEAKETNTFDYEKYINSIEVQKHDHFLIPAGTIHCSGTDCVVLEISTTPNRFTFKLWDWDRVDLDGRPRPINIEHGSKNIDYSRDSEFVSQYLYNHFEIIEETKNHLVESTGLFSSEPLKTERDTFNKKITMDTQGNVQMLCLVEGDEILVKNENDQESEGLIVNYGETFIIPANVSTFSMTPIGKSSGHFVKTMKAYVG